MPSDIEDFLRNVDQYYDTVYGSGDELDVPEGYTPEQQREYNQWMAWFNSYGDPLHDWRPVNIEDFYNNYDYAQQWLNYYQQLADYQGQLDDPRDRIADPEQYWEYPRYGVMATEWLHNNEQFSGALSAFTESQFPSLQRQYEAGKSPLTGFPTRDEARDFAREREQSFQDWLTGMTPEIERRYWAQRPAQRGEKLYAFSPWMRTINW